MADRFCLECPRRAIGARSFAESIQVAKFVMSSTSPDTSIENVPTMAATMRRSISSRSSSPVASIASQNRRWSSAAAGRCTKRSSAVFAHHSGKASFEQGPATRLRVAKAMQVPTEAAASARRAPTTSSTISATRSRRSISHTAATSPKERSGLGISSTM
jgi:hypothetical protein